MKKQGENQWQTVFGVLVKSSRPKLILSTRRATSGQKTEDEDEILILKRHNDAFRYIQLFPS